jgi:hypothetical protein
LFGECHNVNRQANPNQRWNKGASLDQAFGDIRAAGASIVDCIVSISLTSTLHT